MNNLELANQIRSVCSQETAYDPKNWTETNPLWGHCAVVSLLVQDIFGGELLKASLENTPFSSAVSHYWNRLPSGEEIDFTREQFGGFPLNLVGQPQAREYILSFPDTQRRYQSLKDKYFQS